MFLPFDIGEIHGAIELAYQVIEIGWSNVHNAHQQYIEFKEDVESLRDQLETLQHAITDSRLRTGALLAPRPPSNVPRQLEAIFANFKETLEDCRRLLETQSRYSTPQGPVSNIQWYLLVKDEVDMHRDRIAVLNSKLSLALQSLEIQTRDGQTVLMLECTNLLLERIALLDARISRMHGERPLAEPTRRLDVPQPLEDILVSITVARYGNLVSIPMTQALEEIIFYLDRATRWHERRRSTQPCHASQLTNLIRAYWLLQTTKAGDEYQAATRTVSMEQFEQDFPRLGMTTRRFFSKLEDRILEAHSRLTRTLSVDRIPPLDRLLQILEQEIHVWQEHDDWKPQKEDDDNPRRGQKVAACQLENRSTAPGQLLEIYRQDEDESQLTVIKCGAGHPDVVHQLDLRCLHLAPSMEAATAESGFYSLTVTPVKGRRQSGFRLAFKGRGGVFKFQELMTGFKVVDDFPNVVITTQRANDLFGGERKTGKGRLQVWSSTRVSSGSQLPEEFVDEDSKRTRRRSSRFSILSPYAPVLAPLASFSRLTLSLGPTDTSSNRSSYLGAQANAQTPSLTRLSTITSSSTSQSSTVSVDGPPRRTTKVIQVDKRGNVGCILDQPDPPRLIMFLPPKQAQRQGPMGTAASSGTLLVVDVNQYIHINPTLCDCQQDLTTSSQGGQGHNRVLSLDTIVESQGQIISGLQGLAAPQPPECLKVVLEVVNASRITAMHTESDTGGTWNLASAGRFQGGEGLVAGKKLKKVVLEFQGVEEREKFVEYFTQLRRLYLGDLNAAAPR